MPRLTVLVGVLLLGGCGPALEADPDWMLGMLSNARFVESVGAGTVFTVELREDNTGTYARLGCDGEDESAEVVWSRSGGKVVVQGSVAGKPFMDPDRFVSPFELELAPPSCGEFDLVEIAGVERHFPLQPDIVATPSLFRSHPCSASPIEAPACEGPECDGPTDCGVRWCDGGEPEPCER